MMSRNKNKESGIKNWAKDDQPREKLLHKGYAALSDAELIAILIQSGTAEKSAVDLAREILKMSGNNLSQLGKFSIKDLQQVRGIGDARAITLLAALELGRRRQLSLGMELKELSSSAAAAQILIPLMGDLQKEQFCVLCLSAGNKLIHHEFVSSGGLTSTVVDPKIVFKTALQHLCSRMIIAHNHPSGNLKPSRADRAITVKLKAGAQLLDLQLIDHLIIADKKYFSFADEGLL